MSEKPSEKSKMHSVEFVQAALHNYVAPPGTGTSIAGRIRYAARRLGWTYSRTKDAWYADPRISIKADEVRKIEETTGVRYGREELKSIDALIRNADALLAHADEDIPSTYVIAFRALIGALAGSRAARGE